ncbi:MULTISPECIES: hypothetical protein [Providencia]|jgi:hypothetical protein|uniref:hypothetical protein n=1 Tax=Providencia TaxID=586 RepID=UPI0012B6606E|nr:MULTISPECIES: hypothetical protein [Providencia]MTC70068.1 hypothetical protein [Providencia sp. wls1914]MTC76074.1 hypothetical protein [Providencia sp. wls1919]QLR03742.1 hypothetical protein H0913_12405 [Providencia rettgeri]
MKNNKAPHPQHILSKKLSTRRITRGTKTIIELLSDLDSNEIKELNLHHDDSQPIGNELI